MGKKYMDTKAGTLEESILGVWQDAVDDLDEKYTDAQRAARDKSRGRSGRMGTFASGGRETKRDRESVRVHGRDQRAHGLKTRSGQRSEYDRQMRLKKDLLRKKQEREREKLAASYDPTELDLEILVLEQMIEALEDSPNPANSWHLCAKNVVHEEWGSGQTIPTMHAEPDEDGDIAWYDVMFEHGIEEGVLISELKVTKSEGHMHASYNGKKKKMPEAKKLTKKQKKLDVDGDGEIEGSDLAKLRMKETWAEAVRKVKENENGNGEDPSDEDDEDEKKNGKKAKVEINPKMDVDEKKK